MSDLISRQTAIDALYHHMPNKTMDECRAMLHDVPSAQPEQRWIACSERMPEDVGHYLVTIETRSAYSKKRFISISLKDLIGWVSCANIIAWQPLPESYEESGAEMRPST